MMLSQLLTKLVSSGKFFYALILIIPFFVNSLDHYEEDFLFKEIVVVHNSQIKAYQLSHVNERVSYSGVGVAEISSLLGNLL